MKFTARLVPALFFLLALLNSTLATGFTRLPQETTPDPASLGPERKKILIVEYTATEWWINDWKTNTVLCSLVVGHDGLPFADEVEYYCGTAVFNLWANTAPCLEANTGGNIRLCTGVYMHKRGSAPATRKIEVDLPPASATVTISGCIPAGASNQCASLPKLRISGEEPLPNETIIAIHGLLGVLPFSCMGRVCEVPLPATSNQGITVEFWADSSFGDSSPHFTALVRTIPWGDFVAPEGRRSDPRRWYVDVISTQWAGAPLASCSQIWESFPALAGPPAWLTTPSRPELLASTEPFYYLAGSLIQSGVVDARTCPGGGLLNTGLANACGMDAARPEVIRWQNQFDSELIKVGQETGVPAQLMKNVFSRESQFWPGIFQTFKEAGLGQLTENGADTILLWNASFYRQYCPLILEKGRCQQGFPFLEEKEQNLLKGSLVNKVNSACPNCPAGINLAQAGFSVNVFAESLLANCNQAGQIVYNTTSGPAGRSSTYVDLWKFTLVNYNAGAGCLEEAVQEAYRAGRPLDWANVSARLDEACQASIQYVDDITTLASPASPPADQPASLSIPAEQTPSPEVTPTP